MVTMVTPSLLQVRNRDHKWALGKKFHSPVVHDGGFKYSYMMLGWFRNLSLVLLAVVLLGSCSYLEKGFYQDDPFWVPEKTKSLDFFFYEEITGYTQCSPNCFWFQYYIFENGELLYFGDNGNPAKGWHRKQLDPKIYLEILDILHQHRFSQFAPLYNYLEAACPEPFVPDLGGAKFELKVGKNIKKVRWENGCAQSKDQDTILNLDRSIRQVLPLEDWVGKAHYTWQYDLELDNVIFKEDKQ